MKVVRPVVALALAAAVVLGPAEPARAHPLGNFTVNVYSGLRVSAAHVDVDLVVDMAEIPAFQARAEVEAAGTRYAGQACRDALPRLRLWADDQIVPLRLTSSEVAFPPGAGGLLTLRLTCALRAETGGGTGTRDIGYRNDLYDDRVGWREITAIGDGATIVSSNVPAESVSAALTAYPDDLLSSPLGQTAASIKARAGGPGGAEAPRALSLPGTVDRAGDRLTALVTRDFGARAGIVGFVVAVLLGAAHSLAPGHGKTLMAAYLVGQRGSLRDAAYIGLTVTLAHTAGVLALGIVLSIFTGFAPERLYPWFSLVGGVTVSAIGVNLVRRSLARRRVPLLDPGHGHGHDHGHDHEHGHEHDQEHEPGLAGTRVPAPSRPRRHHHHVHGPHRHDVPGHAATVSRGSLLAMGLAGGIVPTPSAVLVLLAAIALGRPWFGVVLVVAYGIGMALTLTGAGLLLVRARSMIEHRLRPGARAEAAARLLPVATAAAIVVAGLVLTARGAGQL